MSSSSYLSRAVTKLRRHGAGDLVRAVARQAGEALPYTLPFIRTRLRGRASRRTLWIHIGAHKTGTSSLQAMLEAERIGLAAQSIWYDRPSFDLALHFAHNSPVPADELARAKAEFRARIDARPEDTVLLSSEHFSGDPYDCYRNAGAVADDLRALVEGFDVRIILCVRRQDEFVQSYYNQHIKVGFCETFAAYRERVRPERLEWDRLAAAYEERFGAENIRVLIYERVAQSGGDLLQTFFGGLGQEFRIRPRNYPRSNESLSEKALELALATYPSLAHEERLQLRQTLLEQYPRKRGEKFTQLSAAESRTLMASLSESNRRFFAKYAGSAEEAAAYGYEG
jgi:hypothetical protein